jgi:hypothetical protein
MLFRRVVFAITGVYAVGQLTGSAKRLTQFVKALSLLFAISLS